METINFSKPIRQSSKGILIIFGYSIFKLFKKAIALFIFLGVSWYKKESLFNLTPIMIFLIIIGGLLVLLVIAILKYLNFKFHLSKDNFHLSTGIINKENIIISKLNIQNVYIKQNFLQQLINVVSLNIETAGDNKSEIEIRALDKTTALNLKKELFNKEHKNHEHIDAIAANNVFFKVNLKRLLLEGISKNHLKSFGVIIAFIFGLYSEFKEYIEDFKIKEQIGEFIAFNDESLFSIIDINFAIIFIGLVFSIIFSVINTLVVNFNLEVIETQKTIEINKGLLSKVSLSLTPSRIQNLVIKTNRIKKYFGLHTLVVKQAMVNVKQHNNFTIVALEKEQVNHLVYKLLQNYTNHTEACKPKPYYKRILAFKMLIPAIIINILVFFIFEESMWWVNFIVILIAVSYVYFGYKKAYYKINDEFITVGSGVIDSITNILEIHKIQSIDLKQTIFQKQRQIASVVIFTASKAVTIPYIEEQEAKLICDFLLFKLESQDKNWM